MASSSYERKLPPRNRIMRELPDMISHDDFDLMVKRKKAAKKTNITRLVCLFLLPPIRLSIVALTGRARI